MLDLYDVLLNEQGYQVSHFNTTVEVMREVERLHPDLIILDVKVNGKEDGLDPLEQLHTSPSTQALPVLLCTAAGATSTRERVEALRLRGVPVVYKPFQMNELLTAIATTLRLLQNGEEEGYRFSR